MKRKEKKQILKILRTLDSLEKGLPFLPEVVLCTNCGRDFVGEDFCEHVPTLKELNKIIKTLEKFYGLQNLI